MRAILITELKIEIKSIMEKSFDNLIYLEKLYMDCLQMETISSQTLDGLKAVKFVKMSPVQFESVANIKIMISQLAKEYKSRNERYTFYPSTSIEFKQSLIDARHCSMVIYFARHNILINLLMDSDQVKLVSTCKSFSLHELDYSLFGFN